MVPCNFPEIISDTAISDSAMRIIKSSNAIVGMPKPGARFPTERNPMDPSSPPTMNTQQISAMMNSGQRNCSKVSPVKS
jgi:hypothetical protein